MSLHGNWVDLIIIVFLAYYSFSGIKRGFLALLAEMVSFIASFLFGLKFYSIGSSFLSSNFSFSPGLANALSFIFLAIISETIIAVIFTRIYHLLPESLFNSKLNHLLGFVPAAIDGLLLCAFFLTVIVSLPVSPSLKSDILSSRIGSELISQTHTVEQSLNQVFAPAIEDSLNFLTVKTGSTQNVDLHFRTTDFYVDLTSETEMLKLVNSERVSHKLKPLALDLKLRSLARAHSEDMFTKGYFSHVTPDGNDPFDRMRAANISYQTAGENLAYAPSVIIAHSGLMNSPGHRANILNPDFGHVGIGVIDAGTYGKMFTQEFTN